ncbi:hypothetical protein ACH5RR_032781 [Cinchona calisaya]|uniref:Uncharacterized protein n=1 Tax=Cinchona calisaya TaxID=153742 RepID=A0ABD2YNA3_9GENT
MVTRNKSKTTESVKKSAYKSTYCDQFGHTKYRCYELVGYPEWWYHSQASRKKNSKKTSTAAVVETNTDDDTVEKGSALVATTNLPSSSIDFQTPLKALNDAVVVPTVSNLPPRVFGCVVDAKIDTEKGDVTGMTLDLDSNLEAEEVPESQDASSSLEEFESLTIYTPIVY